MSELAARCRGLSKRYGEIVAVDGLDLDVRRGECLGLLGPNGAGKTTTVEILEGLVAADAGSVELLGTDWRHGGRGLRQRLGIQLQETQLPDKLSVEETIRLFRSFYREGKPVDRVLDRVGLREKSRKWVRTLSGGQKQRLSLACALVGRPEMLFLDEPTTGLDPQSRRMIWEVVDEFRRGGGTVLLTTHYMDEAQRLCDRVAVVDRGKIISEGSPAALIASLGAEHVIEFEAAPTPALDRLAALPGAVAVAHEDGTLRVTVTEVHHALPALMSLLSDCGADLTRLTTHHATLEDVFVALTGRHLRDA